MHRTVFAGLTAPDENDSITVDGGSFTTVNPDVTDHFLQIGCVTHRHDGHEGIPNPTGVVSASVNLTGGQLEPGITIYLGYTLIDAQGGETELSPVVSTNTQGQIFPETSPPTASADYSAGSLPIGGYSYAFTYRDAAGGVTELQPSVFLQRMAGPASGQAILSGLAAGLGSGLVSWDAWRADEGGAFQLLHTGGTTDTFTDTGFTCTDCTARPPTTNTTNHTSELRVQLPTSENDPSIARASTLNLFLSTDGSFSNPSLYANYPVASGGQVVIIPELVLETGFPPPVNRSIAGAGVIDPDSELSGPWRKAVANRTMLPATGNQDGDIREALADHSLWIWSAEANEWEEHTGGAGGGSGHVIQNASGANMPAEPRLQFTGAVSVSDDPEHSRTIVTVTASAGASPIHYRGEWEAGETYGPGDVVTRLGGSYFNLATSVGNDPASDEVHWGILAAPGVSGSGGVAGLSWKGEWSNVGTYEEGDAVSRSGGSFINLSAGNKGHDPLTHPELWGVIALPGKGITIRGPWNVGTTYATNDVVSRGGNAYASKTNGNIGNDPSTDAEEVSWALLVTKGAAGAPGEAGPVGIKWRGPYSSGTTYAVRDGVFREGNAYVSISSGNKGNDPVSDAEVHWQIFARGGEEGPEGKVGPKGSAGLRYRGAYSGGTIYEVNDVVKKEGKYYVAIAKGKEHAPPNETYWQEFTGGGPVESKVWGVTKPEPGDLAAWVVRVDEFSEAGELIIGLDVLIEGGTCAVTVLKNGTPITHLEGVTGGSYIDMTALKEAGEGGKFFPVKLLDGDVIRVHIDSVGGAEPANLSATLHIRHITWGDS